MDDILARIALCVESGKTDKASPYPPGMKGPGGAGETKRKGKFIIGTVSGDLHDIGKNLVAMMIEGGGWEIIDLGVDVSADKFLRAIEENPGAVIGLSAL